MNRRRLASFRGNYVTSEAKLCTGWQLHATRYYSWHTIRFNSVVQLLAHSRQLVRFYLANRSVSDSAKLSPPWREHTTEGITWRRRRLVTRVSVLLHAVAAVVELGEGGGQLIEVIAERSRSKVSRDFQQAVACTIEGSGATLINLPLDEANNLLL